MKKKDKLGKAFDAAVTVAMILSLALLAKAITDKAATGQCETSEAASCSIVYTDDVESTIDNGEYYQKMMDESSEAVTCSIDNSDNLEPTTYTRVYYPLTMDEREWLAQILAGKAADRNESCQRLVATVMYNDITASQGDLVEAAQEYQLNTPGTPTDQVYKVIDAVFYGGELMLDPEVLWCNDKDHKSAFHDSLVVVCECDGMVFYRAHWPNVESTTEEVMS